MIICAGCERPILDRFLFNVLDRAWHSTCVQCSDCAAPLTDKCFSREGKLYCKEDFFRRFGTKCGGCSQGISPNDLVRRARNKVFHLKCFTCMVCRKQLSTGEELYVLDENKFICKEDYLSSKYSHGSEDELDLDSTSMLDKFDDRLSDKGSIADDCDSRDSSLPPSLPPLRLEGPPQVMDGADTMPHPALLKSPPDSQVTVKIEKNNNDVNSSIGSSNADNNNKENASSKAASEEAMGEEKDGSGSEVEEGDDTKKKTAGTKRRGPRTTIKAKQLEVLKAAFAATPKPTRHIREQLASETGLNMRVIQVWFQNRRSKERRMKQLSALGARRAFFRNPRRMRGLGDEADLMGGPGFAYFDNGEYYPGPFPGAYPGEFYPGDPQGMPFMPPTSGPQGTPPMDPQGVPVGPMPGHDGNYSVMQHEMMQQGPPPTSSPEPGLPPLHQSMEPYMRGGPGFPMHPGEMQPAETW